MKIWEKWLAGGLLAVAVLAAAGFVEDSNDNIGASCRNVGGTPAPRGWFKPTPSCAWSKSFLETRREGTAAPGVEYAQGWCRRQRGSMPDGATSTPDQVLCLLAPDQQ